MKKEIELLDTVALLEDLPQRNLKEAKSARLLKFSPLIFLKSNFLMMKDKHTLCLPYAKIKLSLCITEGKV
jgi:hypothetical protein